MQSHFITADAAAEVRMHHDAALMVAWHSCALEGSNGEEKQISPEGQTQLLFRRGDPNCGVPVGSWGTKPTNGRAMAQVQRCGGALKSRGLLLAPRLKAGEWVVGNLGNDGRARSRGCLPAPNLKRVKPHAWGGNTVCVPGCCGCPPSLDHCQDPPIGQSQ
jgi:hypothetical protein